MKAKINKYLQNLGFKKIDMKLYFLYTLVQDGGNKREAIVMPKGKLAQHHIDRIKMHLNENGWLTHQEFTDMFILSASKRQPRQRSVEAISLNNLPVGHSFYTHKQDREITAIAGYYDKKVKTERLYTICPTTGVTEKIVRVTLL